MENLMSVKHFAKSCRDVARPLEGYSLTSPVRAAAHKLLEAADVIDDLDKRLASYEYPDIPFSAMDSIFKYRAINRAFRRYCLRTESDVVTELLARIGESSMLFNASRFHMLPEQFNMNTVDDVYVGDDEKHVLIIEIQGEPRRLILDEDFGWLWYNREGPEEAQGPNETLPISYGCSTPEAESFMHRLFDKLFTGETQE